MAWIPEEKPSYSWSDWLLMKLVRCGQIPKHVAFIMDGNRRYARQRNLEKIQGHTQGFSKLAETLQWCHDLGISEVTVYAFSIENFKRPQSEVDALFDLAREKFRWLVDESHRLREHGVRVRILGQLDLLPPDVQDVVAKAMAATEDNTKCLLNVAFAYTSRQEITHAIRTLAQAVERKALEPDQVDQKHLESCLYTSLAGWEHTMPDLLIRTSGEVRLSDFLLWQTSYSITYFTDVLWPDFSVRNLLFAMLFYQHHAIFRHKLLQQSGMRQQAIAHPGPRLSVKCVPDHHDVGSRQPAVLFNRLKDSE